VYLDFSGTIARSDAFVQGAVFTLVLSAAAMCIGLLIGVLGASARRAAHPVPRLVAGTYVELVRNTPFLVQIYIIYFGLPVLGLRLPPWPAALIALSIYSGAYMTEIVRAGLQAIDKGQIEAARSLGLSPYRTLRHVVLKQALAAVYPSLTSQFLLTMLASSIVSTISVPELTGAANDVQGMTFRSLEAYLVVAAIYIALTGLFKAAFVAVDRFALAFRHVGR
jgi:polar amino acid transport system permease protein